MRPAPGRPFSRPVLSPLRRPRWQISVAALFASFVLGGGALAAFVLAPQQAFLAWRVRHIPPMDAAAVASAAPDEDLLVTGVLQGNTAAEHDFVLYALERWKVKTDSEGKSYGKWEDLEGYFPDLRLVVGERPLLVQGNPEVRLLGDVHMETYPLGSEHSIPLDAYPLDAGTLRYTGLRDGDQVTVLGHKADSGGIQPSHLFVGDRAAFEAFLKNSGKGIFLAGLCVMALTPLVFGFTLAVLR